MSSERMLIHIMKATEARLSALLLRHRLAGKSGAEGDVAYTDPRGRPTMPVERVEELERIRADLYLAILDYEGK